MLEQYFPILLFIIVGLGLGRLLLSLGALLAPNRPDPENSPRTNAASRRSRTRG